MKKGLKFLIKVCACIAVGTIITFGVLNVVDNFLYGVMQSSYLDMETYRTNEQAELKSEDVISLPEGAELVQYAYNNKYYAYLEDGAVHIYNTSDKTEYAVIREDYPICYYYMMFDKNLILYFVEYTKGNYTTLTLNTFDISTQKVSEYNDINVSNFSKIKEIAASPLVNIFYINIETKTSFSTNNVVYRIDLFNSMGQVKSGMILNKIMMLQHRDRLYYEDTDGGVYTSGSPVNSLFGYADVELIGIDEDEQLYLLNTETNDKVYVVSGNKLVDTIYLTDTDVVTSYCEYDEVYLVYPTYILDLTGQNPHKRIAKLSKYVTFEAIKGDTVYLRTANNKIITTKLLDN